MSPLAFVAIKALVGGLLVVAFSLVGEVLQPERFAGAALLAWVAVAVGLYFPLRPPTSTNARTACCERWTR